MTNLADTDIWYVSVRLPRGTRVTYTFTRDEDLNAAATSFDSAAHLAGRTVDQYNPKTIRYPAPDWPSPWGRTVSLLDLAPTDPQAGRSGRDGASQTTVHELRSSALGRSARVYAYLPPGPAPSELTPLVVLFDGWELANIGAVLAVFDNLIAAGTVPPFVAVMPEPGEHRMVDFSFSDD
ncbi:hypothetical protein GCM10022224_031040 [Nonomuraea antimicrobica]|uniref:Enterochelin esterase N-terminal domain-containing protein n=1 Tax=Nonomuraea antimicrobica TaxID=561173 RepID=A0ABP7BMX6_9ACTN